MFLVRMKAKVPSAGEYVYLSSSFKDGAGKTIRNWTYKAYNAKVYKTRKGAEKAVEQQGNGEVIELADVLRELGDLPPLQ